MIDAHTHVTVDEFWEKRESVIDDFVAMGGRGLVTIGMDAEANMRGIQLVDEIDDTDKECVVKCTVGRHPYEVVRGAIKTADQLVAVRGLASLIESHESSIVAVGECGVDLHYDGAKKLLGEQQQLLALQCQLALEYGLPVVIHSRDAFAETCVVLQDFPGLDIYFHCRGYGPAEVSQVLEWFPGCYIGFCGNVTYKNAGSLRDSLAEVPSDSLLLETDAPYLSPQVVRGQQNQPSYVQHTYEFVYAEMERRNLQSKVGGSYESFVMQVSQNFYRLYGL